MPHVVADTPGACTDAHAATEGWTWAHRQRFMSTAGSNKNALQEGRVARGALRALTTLSRLHQFHISRI